jgi:Na+/H+ antiporter NhaA
MNAIVANVMMRTAPKARTDVRLLTIALFCGIGLLASLCVAALGFDLSAAI